jgi:3-hydroxyacyl-CoA dehydrogenase / enoyl-CoA hydratase / 3-hydroxybutyryl-CoA epimerase
MEKSFKLDIDAKGIGWLTFDYPGEKVNKFSTHVMEELNSVLDEVAANPSVRALVIQSAKKGIFIAGADVKEIYDIMSQGEEVAPLVQKLLSRGQETFNKLEQLRCPTIAVIDGACMGGGTEFSLACTYRVVTDHAKTSIALPEVNLGIIPGWGGTQRLPKLIGLQNSLPMILGGKKVDGKKAFKLKLADSIIPHEFLKDRLPDFVESCLNASGRSKILNARTNRKGIQKVQDYLLEKNPLGRSLIFSQARKGIMKKTMGKYPAPLAALDVVETTYGWHLQAGLKKELDTFVNLTTKHADICENLVNLFFVNEDLKKDPQVFVDSTPKKVDVAGVLGAGVMGGGIAWLFSYKDIPVRIKDIQWDAVSKGFEAANSIYKQLQKIRKLNTGQVNLKMHKISGATDYSGFQNADIIVEAVVENMDLKKKVFAELEEKIRPDTLICSNTSALSITEMQKDLKHPERFVGMHFFNPVNRMPLVEIIPGEKTSKETVASMVSLVKKLGKTPVVVGDCAGFLVNRVLIPSMNEGLLMLEEGLEIERVDNAITHFGMPMGPFTLADEVGNDVGYKVALILNEAYGDRMSVPPTFKKIVDAGLFGKKMGRGFYIHKGKEKTLNPEVSEILGTTRRSHLSAEEMVDRFVLVMLNEACRCLEEKIIENPAYLDMAMITGTGFPPFRGGLLRYADSRGIPTIVQRMKEFSERFGERFKPCSLLEEMASEGKSFYGPQA